MTVFSFVGASMFLGMVLQYIPIAALFGVFLYMGVASLGGIQLYQRIVLFITPVKHHPMDVGYIRFVSMIVFCIGLTQGCPTFSREEPSRNFS